MAETRDEKLFKALEKKHPHWEDWNEEWELYRDVIGDAMVAEEDYLPKNKLESLSQYEFRKDIARWIPETPLAVNKLVTALYNEKPKRELKSTELEKFEADVDREGTDMDQYMQRVIRSLLSYGSIRVLVNVPKLQKTNFGTVEVTRADELAMDIRPFCILYTPLNVPNWDVDQFGRLTMVLIKEESWRKEDLLDPEAKHVKITRFIMYTNVVAKWWEFKEVEGKQQLIEEHEEPHGLGMIPMVVEYWPQKLKTMIGSAFIRYMSRADVQLFQAETDLVYDAYIHAHPTLRVWTKKPIKDIGVGSQHFLKLVMDDGKKIEDADYMPVPESGFNVIKTVIENRLNSVYRQAGTDPLGVMQPSSSVFQASGVSRAWSFGTSEGRILGDLADTAADIERQIFEIASRYFSEELDVEGQAFKGDIQYPEEFDLSSTATLIEETDRIGEIVNSPTLHRKLHKRIAASKVGDASAEELKEIFDEIDENELLGQQPQRTSNVFNMPTEEGIQPEEGSEEEGQSVGGAASAT